MTKVGAHLALKWKELNNRINFGSSWVWGGDASKVVANFQSCQASGVENRLVFLDLNVAFGFEMNTNKTRKGWVIFVYIYIYIYIIYSTYIYIYMYTYIYIYTLGMYRGKWHLDFWSRDHDIAPESECSLNQGFRGFLSGSNWYQREGKRTASIGDYFSSPHPFFGLNN